MIVICLVNVLCRAMTTYLSSGGNPNDTAVTLFHEASHQVLCGCCGGLLQNDPSSDPWRWGNMQVPLAVTTLVHFIWPSSDDIVAPDIPSKGINDHCRWLLESVLIQLVVIATRTCSYSTELTNHLQQQRAHTSLPQFNSRGWLIMRMQ